MKKQTKFFNGIIHKDKIIKYQEQDNKKNVQLKMFLSGYIEKFENIKEIINI